MLDSYFVSPQLIAWEDLPALSYHVNLSASDRVTEGSTPYTRHQSCSRYYKFCKILRWLVVGFPPWQPGSGHVEYVVDKAALEQVFSEYFSFPYQAFHWLLHTHHQSSSSRPGIIDHLVASVIVDSVPLHPKEKIEPDTHYIK
jgi:hypothetical protein